MERYIILIPFLAATFLILRRRVLKPRKLKFPPGPKGVPILGNALDFPKERECETYTAWAKIYGDIVGLKAMGNTVILLNSLKVARDLLEKRASIYSERPISTMFELVEGDTDLVMLPYGEAWRRLRRLFHVQFQPSSIPMIEPLQTQGARVLLRSLLDNPQSLFSSIIRVTGATQYKIVYGGDITDEHLDLAQESLVALDECTKPGAFIVDTFPFLKYTPAWFPPAVFKRKALQWREVLYQLRHRPFSMMQNAVSSGEYAPSFYSMMQNFGGVNGYTQLEMARSAAAAYAGGVDTTASTLETFFLTMALYPDAQRRAQQELDALLFNNRLPCNKDRGSLPYLEALFKEVLRWNPTGPTGVPHRLKEDDTYEGYHIPAGTVVIANIWSILHDENVFEDPYVFKPERYLVKDDLLDSRSVVFGFGRRICPGKFAADASLWITMASVLSVFDILPDPEANIRDVNQETLFTSGLFHRPLPFKCIIKPRSTEAKNLISESANAEI